MDLPANKKRLQELLNKYVVLFRDWGKLTDADRQKLEHELETERQKDVECDIFAYSIIIPLQNVIPTMSEASLEALIDFFLSDNSDYTNFTIFNTTLKLKKINNPTEYDSIMKISNITQPLIRYYTFLLTERSSGALKDQNAENEEQKEADYVLREIAPSVPQMEPELLKKIKEQANLLVDGVDGALASSDPSEFENFVFDINTACRLLTTYYTTALRFARIKKKSV